MNCLLVDWEQVRKDCKYPKSDNNEGYIFGISMKFDWYII